MATGRFDQRLCVGVSGRRIVVGREPVVNGRAEPQALLHELLQRCQCTDRTLLLFDDLSVLADRWGADVTERFFVTACPQLFQAGAIAYWSVPLGGPYGRLRAAVEDVTQCVLVLEASQLRIAKAEGRPAGVEGQIFGCAADVEPPHLEAAPAAARVGAALRAARLQRRLSQATVARLAGVSPSAISQAERGRRGLSLDTLLRLTAKLNTSLDELLRTERVHGYRLGRRRLATRPVAFRDRPLPLLDDPGAGLRAYLVELPPRHEGAPHIDHKGTELVAVAAGLVQVVLTSGRPVLREGESLLVERATVTGWRNLGPSAATLFWILRD